MRAPLRKIRRRRQPGEITIEQTRDPAVIEAMLDRAAAGLRTKMGEEGECFLVAYSGEEPVGIVGLHTEVDVALMGPVFVLNKMRQRAIGVRLVSAVRRAAHGRGARILYAIVPQTVADYFVRLGFAEATSAEFYEAFGQVSTLHCKAVDLERCRPLRVDVFKDEPRDE